MGPSPSEVFHKLLAGVTGRRWSELPELYAEDTVVRHPLLPFGGPVLDGREAIRVHFAAAAELPLEMPSGSPRHVSGAEVGSNAPGSGQRPPDSAAHGQET